MTMRQYNRPVCRDLNPSDHDGDLVSTGTAVTQFGVFNEK